jgi:hypothetical protein
LSELFVTYPYLRLVLYKSTVRGLPGKMLARKTIDRHINLMNLIPVWTLDEGQAMFAINRLGRIGIAIAASYSVPARAIYSSREDQNTVVNIINRDQNDGSHHR